MVRYLSVSQNTGMCA